MDIVKAREILRVLADGVNPLTGELLPDESVCNQGEVVRAFYCILNELDAPQQKPKGNTPENAGKPWSESDHETLVQMFDSGCTRREMRDHFKRSDGAIAARLVHLGKIAEREEYRKMR